MNQKELDIVMSQKDEALKLIQAAKIALLRNRPFYGALIGSLPLYPDATWLPTAATDGRNIYYNPEFIAGMHPDRLKLVMERLENSSMPAEEKKKQKEYIDVFYRKKTIKEIIFIFEHEIRHVINLHITRGKAFHAETFNIAADHYINTHLVMEHGKDSKQMSWFVNGANTVFDKTKEFGFMAYAYCKFKYHGWTSEAIYKDILGDQSQDGDEVKAAGKHMTDPSVTDEVEESILGYDESAPSLSQQEIDRNAEITQRQIASAAHAALSAGGDCPEDIRKLVAEFGKPQIDYVSLIRKRMTSLVQFNRSYKRPHRRSGGLTKAMQQYGVLSPYQSVVMPGHEKDKTIDVVIGFDVSGSVNDVLLKRIFREIMSLTTQYKVFRITLFCWSTKVGNVVVYDEKNIREIVDYKIKTTYGTHASCAFEYIDQHLPDAQEVILFTDGYIESGLDKHQEWPKKYDKMLWVIFNNTGFKQPFGQQVLFDAYAK